MRCHLSACLLVAGTLLLLAACGGAGAPPDIPFDPGTRPEPPGTGDLPWNPPDDDGGETPNVPNLSGGVLVTIDTAGEQWRWWVTNPTSAQVLQDVWMGTRTMGRLGGVIRSGPGAADHNAPWSWHLDPQQTFATSFPLTIRPNDALTPSDVENRLSFWLAGNGRFMPADATIVEFVDLR